MSEPTEQPTGEGGTPSPAPATGTPTPSVLSPGTGGQPAVTTEFKYKEDRSNWIPKDRFDQINQRAHQSTTRAQQLEQELASERARVQALAGVSPKDPKTQQSEEVRAAFFEMFPNFKRFADLTEAQMEALVKTPERMQEASAAEHRQWQRHGNQQVAAISEQVADALGTDKLSPRQESTLRTAFTNWLKTTAASEFQASGGQSSETLRKYEDGDQSVTQAFVTEYIADFITPARRQATAQNINRNRPVPNSSGRSQTTTPVRPEKFNSLDERIAYGAELFKERGGSFGG